MDKDDFGKIYQRYFETIFRHCYFRVDNREQAKDLAQSAFIKTWEYLKRGKRIDNMKAFLYKVANNLVVDYYRKHKTTSLDQLKEKGFEPSLENQEAIEAKIDADRLKELLTLLNSDYREIIVMRYVDGLKPREISLIIEESQNVISVRLHRAVKAFRKVCRQNGYDF